jgi:L-rhamnose mutarotase
MYAVKDSSMWFTTYNSYISKRNHKYKYVDYFNNNNGMYAATPAAVVAAQWWMHMYQNMRTRNNKNTPTLTEKAMMSCSVE